MKKELHITALHSGKMKGIVSINVSSTQCKAKCGLRKSCYALRLEGMRPSVKKAYIQNGEILSRAGFKPPRINAAYVRFNAFGELINKQHMKNLVEICLNNPQTNFTLWTKRMELVKGVHLPQNLTIIQSSKEVNVVDEMEPEADKVFTVYTAKFIRDNKITVNCGVNKKTCFECLYCYAPGLTDETHINEKIK